MRIHFIAIGGAAMHNLAIALHKKGHKITGSDDEIFEPSKGRLEKYGLLPKKFGWIPEKVSIDLDMIILGMHARKDNPELIQAQKLEIPIYSFPEFVYEQTKNKTRAVIGGSHGKTTITAMIMHVLKYAGVTFDYLVGSQLEGFETMVDFHPDSKIAVIEGDEYLTSPIDLKPKFFHYQPHFALISGIAWDHINVFPTFENYVEQFKKFTQLIEPNGSLVYFSEDNNLLNIARNTRKDIKTIAYSNHLSEVIDETTYLKYINIKVPLKIFGEHNLQNIQGAYHICKLLGIEDETFYGAISKFTGTKKRLELIAEGKSSKLFIDFAHSPSKVKATLKSVRKQFPSRKLIACLELHTFSSLKKEFLPEYKGSMDDADYPIVFFNEHVIELKKLKKISTEEIISAFKNKKLKVFNNTQILSEFLSSFPYENSIFLFMSSGNFSGLDLELLKQRISLQNK